MLQHIKLGVFDVIPSNSLEGLTAEDLRLLLNGVGDINVQTLISYTSFNDESGRSSTTIRLCYDDFQSVLIISLLLGSKANNVETQCDSRLVGCLLVHIQ